MKLDHVIGLTLLHLLRTYSELATVSSYVTVIINYGQERKIVSLSTFIITLVMSWSYFNSTCHQKNVIIQKSSVTLVPLIVKSDTMESILNVTVYSNKLT